jgi:hypothetical protein
VRVAFQLSFGVRKGDQFLNVFDNSLFSDELLNELRNPPKP